MDENTVLLGGRLESVRRLPMRDPERECVTILLSIANPDAGKRDRLELTLWDDFARQVSMISEGASVKITGRLLDSRWQHGAKVVVTGLTQLT